MYLPKKAPLQNALLKFKYYVYALECILTTQVQALH